MADHLTITEAAAAAGRDRSTIRRALDRGAFPGAWKDTDDPRGTWRIPVADLEAAGYPPQGTPGDVGPDASGAPQGGPSAAVVPVRDLGPLFDRLADAESRAARAEAEVAFLRERLAELRAREQAADDRRLSWWQRRRRGG